MIESKPEVVVVPWKGEVMVKKEREVRMTA